MKLELHKAEERGSGEYGWLSTRYSFSFADWYEPRRMGFGALRVLNDDSIAAGAGFSPHSHRDMEIITIVTSGTIAHKDSGGGEGTVGAGEVQAMSAGSGVTHSEFNAFATEPLTLFQLWIETDSPGTEPRYAQMKFPEITEGNAALLVAPLTEPAAASGTALGIYQSAYITRASLGTTLFSYALKKEGNGVYIFVISGDVTVGDTTLQARDAAGITEVSEIPLSSSSAADVLIIEVPV